MHSGDILPRRGVFTTRGSFGNASGRYFARNVALRLIGVRFGGVSFKGCAFVCAGERKVVIAVFCPRRSTASVPWGSGRCGAAEFRVLDVAVDAMAAEQAEHERVQVQVQVRARMPLLPRRCRVWQATPIIACCMALTCC